LDSPAPADDASADRRREETTGAAGGAGAYVLELVVVVEDQFVGLESGCEGEREDDGEEREEEATTAQRGHVSLAEEDHTCGVTWREM
jgi:hypothetical protein